VYEDTFMREMQLLKNVLFARLLQRSSSSRKMIRYGLLSMFSA
jgi:hypothetical protein